MIAVNELRIGNWYNSPRGIERLNYAESLQEIESYPQKFNGIPLTPEILGKAGFVLVDSLKTCIRFRSTQGHIFYINKRGKDYWLNGYKYYPQYISSLHQLQNLYFALTGEELSIEL